MTRTYRNSMNRITARLWKWQAAVDKVEYFEEERLNDKKYGHKQTSAEKRRLTIAKRQARELTRQLQSEFLEFLPAFNNKFGK